MSLLPQIFFTRRQRAETIVLVAITAMLALTLYFVRPQIQKVGESTFDLIEFQTEIDQLTATVGLVENEIQPFNPNFISDYKAYVLNIPPEAIDRLRKFRADDKWINSAAEFQSVTLISDELLMALTPLFSFPEWTQNRGIQLYSDPVKIDINEATVSQLELIKGIGKVSALRILQYRDGTIGGFADMVELNGVYGLPPEVITELKKYFYVGKPRVIEPFNALTVEADQLVTIPFIDYELAHEIIEQRALHRGELTKDILLKIKNFPVDKLDIILLYLYFSK